MTKQIKAAYTAIGAKIYIGRSNIDMNALCILRTNVWKVVAVIDTFLKLLDLYLAKFSDRQIWNLENILSFIISKLPWNEPN